MSADPLQLPLYSRPATSSYEELLQQIPIVAPSTDAQHTSSGSSSTASYPHTDLQPPSIDSPTDNGSHRANAGSQHLVSSVYNYQPQQNSQHQSTPVHQHNAQHYNPNNFSPNMKMAADILAGHLTGDARTRAAEATTSGSDQQQQQRARAPMYNNQPWTIPLVHEATPIEPIISKPPLLQHPTSAVSSASHTANTSPATTPLRGNNSVALPQHIYNSLMAPMSMLLTSTDMLAGGQAANNNSRTRSFHSHMQQHSNDMDGNNTHLPILNTRLLDLNIPSAPHSSSSSLQSNISPSSASRQGHQSALIHMSGGSSTGLHMPMHQQTSTNISPRQTRASSAPLFDALLQQPPADDMAVAASAMPLVNTTGLLSSSSSSHLLDSGTPGGIINGIATPVLDTLTSQLSAFPTHNYFQSHNNRMLSVQSLDQYQTHTREDSSRQQQHMPLPPQNVCFEHWHYGSCKTMQSGRDCPFKHADENDRQQYMQDLSILHASTSAAHDLPPLHHTSPSSSSTSSPHTQSVAGRLSYNHSMSGNMTPVAPAPTNTTAASLSPIVATMTAGTARKHSLTSMPYQTAIAAAATAEQLSTGNRRPPIGRSSARRGSTGTIVTATRVNSSEPAARSHHASPTLTGKKQYNCEHCDKLFPSQSALHMHMLVHTGDKPHQCTFADCNRSFRQRGHLVSHLRRHTGEKPFTCPAPNCDRDFKDKSGLNMHIKKHHPDVDPTAIQQVEQEAKQRRKALKQQQRQRHSHSQHDDSSASSNNHVDEMAAISLRVAGSADDASDNDARSAANKRPRRAAQRAGTSNDTFVPVLASLPPAKPRRRSAPVTTPQPAIQQAAWSHSTLLHDNTIHPVKPMLNLNDPGAMGNAMHYPPLHNQPNTSMPLVVATPLAFGAEAYTTSHQQHRDYPATPTLSMDGVMSAYQYPHGAQLPPQQQHIHM